MKKEYVIAIFIVAAFVILGYFIPRITWGGSKAQWDSYTGKTGEKTAGTIGGFIFGLLMAFSFINSSKSEK